jgi:hypothetical protein
MRMPVLTNSGVAPDGTHVRLTFESAHGCKADKEGRHAEHVLFCRLPSVRDESLGDRSQNSLRSVKYAATPVLRDAPPS